MLPALLLLFSALPCSKSWYPPPAGCQLLRPTGSFAQHVLRVSGGMEEEEEEEVNEQVLPKEACLSREEIMTQSALRIVHMGKKAKKAAAAAIAAQSDSLGFARRLLDLRDGYMKEEEGGSVGKLAKVRRGESASAAADMLVLKLLKLVLGADWQQIRDEEELLGMLGGWEEEIIPREEMKEVSRKLDEEKLDVSKMIEASSSTERLMWEWLDGVIIVLNASV